MKENLTKTLTAGLMHGLKVKATDLDHNEYPYKVPTDEGEIEQWSFNDDEIVVGNGCYSINQVRPYLRSWDKLTEKITHKGSRFVPVDELKKIHPFEGTSSMMAKHIIQTDPSIMPVWLQEILRSWHFNVDELSPDEFIEVNETNNPYK